MNRGLKEFYFVLVHLEGKLTFLFQSKNFLKHSFNVEIIFRWSFNVGALPHFLEYFNNEYSDLRDFLDGYCQGMSTEF